MEYFKVRDETDHKIIGSHPQVQDLRIDFHKARASQWGKISTWTTKGDIPNLKNFVLDSKSKLTDVLSNNYVHSVNGLILSQRSREVLEGFKINGSFHPASVYEKKIKKDYQFLWYELNGKSAINFLKSTFAEYYRLPGQEKIGKIVAIESFEDFKLKWHAFMEEKLWDTFWDIEPQVLVFKEYFDCTPAFGQGLICNEKVKKAIEDNHLTGFVFSNPISTKIEFE